MEDKRSNGFIVIYRSILNWEWYDDTNTKAVFLHLLLKANHKEERWHGVLVQRGQLITSVRKLAKETGLSIMNVRTALKHLESTHEITQVSKTKYTVISIQKYDDYQKPNTVTNKQPTQYQHTPNTRLTTNNNINNDNNEEQERDGGTAAMKPGFWEDQ